MIKTTKNSSLLKSVFQCSLKSTLFLGLSLMACGSCLSQVISPQYMRISSGFAKSPPRLNLPGAYISIGLEQPFGKKVSLTGEVSAAHMQKKSSEVDDFTEKAFVVNWDFGVDLRKTISQNDFGLLAGPVMRYFKGKSVGDRLTLGDGTVIQYDVDDESGVYLGYYLGGYWEHELQDHISIGLRYKWYIFFDQFSNHTLGITFKRRL